MDDKKETFENICKEIDNLSEGEYCYLTEKLKQLYDQSIYQLLKCPNCINIMKIEQFELCFNDKSTEYVCDNCEIRFHLVADTYLKNIDEQIQKLQTENEKLKNEIKLCPSYNTYHID